jgi:hypothetical protein
MLQIYLDQNKWVAVAQVITGHEKSAPFREIVGEMFAHAAAGRVSFPLSTVHIEETTRIADNRRRMDLARAMIVLSRRAAIAPLSRLRGPEFDQALHAVFGRPEDPERPEPFGLGLGFTCGLPSESERTPLGNAERAMVEFFALAAGDSTRQLAEATARRRAGAARYGAIEAGNAVRFAEAVRRFGLDRAFVTVAGHVDRDLIGRMIANDISVAEFADLGPEGCVGLLRKVPSLRASTEVRMAKLRNTSARWEPNDLADIRALSVAAVYCDVVVGERSWTGYMRSGGLADWCRAALLTDLNDLADHLAAA